MIDIIIPAYNAHKTINKTIDSILTQTYQDWNITIVNDGGDPYNINNIYGLIELNYNENKGPGYARNYGLKHTHGEFITFIDADDYLECTHALQSLLNCMKQNTGLCIGGILSENSDGTKKLLRGNGNFMHGKLYRRKFLEEYNILCNENSRCCEDSSFNSLCFLCMDKYSYTTLSEPVYRWTYNNNSLGRNNVDEWEHKLVPRGVVENKIYVYDKLKQLGIDNDKVVYDKVHTMLKELIVYLSNSINYPQFNEYNRETVFMCYRLIYKEIEHIISPSLIVKTFNSFNIKDITVDSIFEILDVLKQV